MKTVSLTLTEEMKNIAENIILSYDTYETKVQNIGAIFDATFQFLEGFDIKGEQEKISVELRENLAKNESLRKKDFDNIMGQILSTQNERENQVKNSLKSYLHEQKKVSSTFKENLSEIKDALREGEIQRLKDFHSLIQKILAQQNERKTEVVSKLKEFQRERDEMAKKLKELLAKGRELRIRDLKSMLNEFKRQRKERKYLKYGEVTAIS